MRLRPRTKEQAFAAVEALKDPGQEAYLVNENTIRICNPYLIYAPLNRNLITNP